MGNCELCKKSIDLGQADKEFVHNVCMNEYERRKRESRCVICNDIRYIHSSLYCINCNVHNEYTGYPGSQ